MRDRGIKKGGLRDPVARSIRNEQNRDAAPTKEEVEAMHNKKLAEKGCLVCGEDDPENLKMYQHPWFPSCSALQVPPLDRFEPKVFCHEHYRSPKTLARAELFRKAWDHDALGVVLYECGASEFIEEPEEKPHPARPYPPRPEVHAKCLCGSSLKAVRWLNKE